MISTSFLVLPPKGNSGFVFFPFPDAGLINMDVTTEEEKSRRRHRRGEEIEDLKGKWGHQEKYSLVVWRASWQVSS
jgi:hypothetical protein